jgi:hypothetical protein
MASVNNIDKYRKCNLAAGLYRPVSAGSLSSHVAAAVTTYQIRRLRVNHGGKLHRQFIL